MNSHTPGFCVPEDPPLTTFGKLDVTGPSHAKKAILWFYDIFGFYPQTIQGADILASSNSNPYLVIMPDFFEGNPAKIEWYPPVTDDQLANLGKFIKTSGEMAKTLPRIPKITEDVQKKYTAIEKWGPVGFCWGGKVVCLSSGTDTIFVASAQSSPALVDPEDAAKVTIPMMVLASKDEDIALIKRFKAALKVKKIVKIKDQVHGYMSAR